MPTNSTITKKDKMAEALTLVKQSIEQKIGLSDKINSLICKMDMVRDEPKKDYSPSNS